MENIGFDQIVEAETFLASELVLPETFFDELSRLDRKKPGARFGLPVLLAKKS